MAIGDPSEGYVVRAINGTLIADLNVTRKGEITTEEIPTPGGGGANYQTVQDEGSDLAQRNKLNFTGTAVAATDDGVNNRTNVTVDAYSTVQDEGTPVTQRATLDFQGAGVSVADSGGKTVVTVGSGGAANYQTVQEEGADLTQRAKLNFVGPQVTAADDAGNARTDVTFSREVHYVEHTFDIKSPAVGSFLGFNVFLASGETKRLAKCRATVDTGTTLTYKLARNGADVAGFGTTGAPLASSTAGTTTDPADVALADGDLIGLVIVNAGTALEVAVTVAIEVS